MPLYPRAPVHRWLPQDRGPLGVGPKGFSGSWSSPFWIAHRGDNLLFNGRNGRGTEPENDPMPMTAHQEMIAGSEVLADIRRFSVEMHSGTDEDRILAADRGQLSCFMLLEDHEYRRFVPSFRAEIEERLTAFLDAIVAMFECHPEWRHETSAEVDF